MSSVVFVLSPENINLIVQYLYSLQFNEDFENCNKPTSITYNVNLWFLQELTLN